MTQDTLRRLIDLEGIAAIERGMNLPNRHWAPENDDLDQRVDRYSIQHFGRTFEQCRFHYSDRFCDLYDLTEDDDDDGVEITPDRQFVRDEIAASQAWMLHFEALSLPFDQQRPLWAALGWDVTGPDGQPLTCLEAFAPQIIASVKGLPLQGEDGVDTVEAIKAEDWGSSLEAEARKFKSGLRR